MTDYFSDQGGNQNGLSFPQNYSFHNILASAYKSGLIGPTPLLRDTSDIRPFSEGFSFHFTGNAMDFGNDSPNGSPQMDTFAAWLAQHFGPYSLEIIHLNMDQRTSVEWKFGAKKPYGWYTVDLPRHLDHVHWAITNEGLRAAGMETDMAQVPHVDTRVALNMGAWQVRVVQGLLQAHGGMIAVDNTKHTVLSTVVRWFQQQAGLTVDGDVGPKTGQALLMRLGNEK